MSMTAEVGTVYDVIAHREVSPEANFWVFEIPALGAVGQAVKLGQVAARKVLDHAATRKREAVTLLRVEKKYSANDTARVLGVTRQRVYQLTR